MAIDYHLAAAQREEQLAQQQRNFEQELRTDPRYQAYLAGYAPASVEGFIKHYAAHKVKCLREGPNMVKFRLHQAIEHQEDSYERLFDIQQKKLFDLQVRWRAGEITLPGMYVGRQFDLWGQYIHACPWLPPITPTEYALYCDYLASPACQEVGCHPDHRRDHDWQDYDRMRDDWRRTQPNPPPDDQLDCTPYPAWYAYYDACHGAPAGYPFATHTDHKGEREEHYMHLTRQDEQATNPTPPYVPDPRPFYYDYSGERSFDDDPGLYIEQAVERMAGFARAFDPAPEEFVRYYQALVRLQNEFYSHHLERTASSRELLWDAKGPWPVAAHADWRVSIVEAAQALHRYLLLAALPAVFEDYQFRLATGLVPAAPDQYRAYHDDTKPTDDPAEKCAVPKLWAEMILRGRELAGEPQDYNY